VSVFTENCTVWQGRGWARGSGRQPGGKPPSARSTWRLGSTTPSPQHNATWRLICLLLGAAQGPRGAWAAYTFSIITSIGIKNIIFSFLIIFFLV